MTDQSPWRTDCRECRWFKPARTSQVDYMGPNLEHGVDYLFYMAYCCKGNHPHDPDAFEWCGDWEQTKPDDNQ